MSGKVEISSEDMETITALYRAELQIAMDVANQIDKIEHEGELRFKANQTRRDRIEKKYLNGMTRFEWTEKFGLDPFTGESIDQMMANLKAKLYGAVPGLEERVDKLVKQMEKASKAPHN